MHINDFSEKFQGGIDPAKLENVKHLGGGGIRAACPACRVAGSDKSGDHLLIQANGKFGCAANPDDHQHRKEIFRLVGMTTGDAGRNGSTKKVVASYDYSDKDGKVLYQVVRYEGKKFIQRRADPDRPGQWIEGTGCMKGVRLMLYRLPEVLKAKADGKRVVISEGEKDCDRLAKEGFTATCNVGGASKKSGDKKWLPQYTETLTGMDVPTW